MTKSLISAEIKTIDEILKKKKSFLIPLYQRKYEWSEELISQLMNDIFNYSMNNDDFENSKSYQYNIGSIYYFEKKNNLVIVDGQQRLTTIFLILNEIKNVFKNKWFDNGEAEFLIKEIEGDYLYKNEYDSSKLSEIKTLKLKRKYGPDNNDFESAINNKYVKNINENIFEKNKKIIFKFLNSRFENFNDLKKFYKNLVSDIDLVFIKMEDNASPRKYNEFFANLNLKSKPLNILDLIKNYVYSYLLIEKNENEVEKNIIEYFEIFDKRFKELKKNDDKTLIKYNSFFLKFYKLKLKQKASIIKTYDLIQEYFYNNLEFKNKYINDNFNYKIIVFLNFFNFIFDLNKFKKDFNKKNENEIKLLWLSNSYFDSFLLIFYKIFINVKSKFKNNESEIDNSEFNFSIFESKEFGKYVDSIFEYTISKILSGNEGSNNVFWNKLALSNESDNYESFSKEVNKQAIKESLSKKYIKNLDINNTKIKNIDSALKIALFLKINDMEFEKKNYNSFNKLELMHIMPPELKEKINLNENLEKSYGTFNHVRDYILETNNKIKYYFF